MIFTNEFVVAPDVLHMDKEIDKRIEYLKKESFQRIAGMMTTYYDHEEMPHDGKKFKVELQVFSRKEWDEFRSAVKAHILKTFRDDTGYVQLRDFQKLFDKLDEAQRIRQSQTEEKQ